MILAILTQNQTTQNRTTQTTIVIILANHQHQKKQKNEAAENCCNKAECEKKPIVGCYQVIDDSLFSIMLDEDDQEFLYGSTEGIANRENSGIKCQVLQFHIFIEKDTHKNRNSIKSSRSTCYGDHVESLIVNKSSTRAVLSESHHSSRTFSSRSECFADEVQSVVENSNPASAYQLYKNETAINESEIANFASLSVSRIEASPPEEKKDSKLHSMPVVSSSHPSSDAKIIFQHKWNRLRFMSPKMVMIRKSQ